MTMRNTRFFAGVAAAVVLTAGSMTTQAQVNQRQTRAQLVTNARLTGTYQLESTRGSDPGRVADAATRTLPAAQRDRAYERLLEKLEPPQQLSLSREGNVITIASDRGAQSSFIADGRTERERDVDGRVVTSRAVITGDQLQVTTAGGARGTDFTVIFQALDNGNTLRVTRRLGDENLTRPVTIESFYSRTAPEPEWDVYGAYTDPADRTNPGRGRGRRGAVNRLLDIPDGTRLVATLDTPISMRTTRDGEPFTMTVQTPGQYQGARIDGVISRVRDASANGMDLRFVFERIDLSGQSVNFDALADTIRLEDGRTIQLIDEGAMQQSTGSDKTVRNGTIGAAVGAIIGAIAGGGKGALIGAAVGGAGGVIVARGQETLEIPRGSEFSLTVVR
jgi:uncharacterized protein YcfJ